jgi:Xaa-Pro aminopeptidase
VAGIREQLERRRSEAAARWNLSDGVVLVGAGSPVPVPGRGDLTYRFRSHSEYLYLTDRERPGGVLAYDPREGWVDFVAPVTREEMLWEGAAEGDGEGIALDRLDAWLGGRSAAWLGEPPPGQAADEALRRELNEVRRVKDEVELGRMRAAERATAAGFAALPGLVEPGRSERALQIELEAEFFRAGGDALAFDTIVASGPNSAVLHFPPTRRELRAGELVLVDAGAEVRAYASDVTRTYTVGEPTREQAELLALVRAANAAATALCTPGTEWRDVHRAAALVIGEGLVSFGLLRGDPEGLVERGAVTLFFPHGVGHMVGLGVRDAGERLPGREPAPGLPALRVDLPLRAGHVFTVEPGVYFVPALLRDPELRAAHRTAVDWERAEALLGFGGIRIEDDVLVTDGGPEVLTADVDG